MKNTKTPKHTQKLEMLMAPINSSLPRTMVMQSCKGFTWDFLT